jgi:Capsule assembly protein Wzi
MLSLRRLACLAAAALSLVVAPGARGQGTATLPTSDPVYGDIDRLSELSFLDSTIIGQRPYSRREIGRIIRVARDQSNRMSERDDQRALTDLELTIGDGILRRLEIRFSREVDDTSGVDPVVASFDDALLSVVYTDAERRGFPASFSAPTEATIGSLLPRRLSTPVIPGWTLAVEAAQRLEPTSWLAFTARERFDYVWANDDSLSRGNAEILLGGIRARYRNVALSVGRDQVAWAQTADDGLMLASDAPALDQLSLSSDYPFLLPGFLRVLGVTEATILLADLGPSRVRSHSKLLAYKVSVSPNRRAEIGATFMNHYGGEGGRPASIGNRLVDFLPFIDIFRRHDYADTTSSGDVDSDKVLGLDGRLFLGGLRGVLLTGELLIDDFDVHRIPQLFSGYGSQTFNLIVPRFVSPLLSLKLTAKHMGIVTYTHGALTNGMTTRGRLLGDELGPDAKAFGAQLTWQPTAAFQFGVYGRSAIYSNAEYVRFYADPNNTDFVVRKVSRTADELRDRAGAVMLVQTDAGPTLSLRFVTERSRNYLFQGGRFTGSAGELAFHLLF